MVAHSNLTSTDLHEPKGVAAAGANEVYLADGAGSGAWTHARDHVDINQNAKVVQVTVTNTDLAAAGTKTVLGGSGTRRYAIRDILLYKKTAWSGGDRDIVMTDGTSTWTTIPSANLDATPSFVRWFDTDLPGPSTTDDFRTSSQAGVTISLQYSGGATDHTAGEFTFVVFYERTQI